MERLYFHVRFKYHVMHANEIKRASSLLQKHDALVTNIKYLLKMAEVIVTGNTKVQIAVHLCDMDKKADLHRKREAKEAMTNLDGPPENIVVVKGKDGNPPPVEDLIKSIMRDATRQRAEEDQQTCMDYQEDSENELAAGVLVCMINSKKEKLKLLREELKQLGIEF